jgi:hypothetical protein
LRSGSAEPIFCVGGHHWRIFAVELPSWLPRNVLLLMVDKYRDVLARDLELFSDNSSQNNRSRTDSILSNSAISVSSDKRERMATILKPIPVDPDSESVDLDSESVDSDSESVDPDSNSELE